MTVQTSPPTTDQESLRGAIRAIFRSWPIILLCAIVAVGASVLYSSKDDSTTTYQASTSIAFSQDSYQGVIAGGGGALDAERQLQTAADIISLPDIRLRVARRLGATVSRGATIKPVYNAKSNLMSVLATAPSPRAAALVANATADEYLQFRHDLSSENIDAARKLLGEQASAAPTRAQRRSLVAKRNNLDTAQALNDDNATIVQRATAPVLAAGTSRERTAAIALILGLAVGVAIALFRGPKAPPRRDPAVD